MNNHNFIKFIKNNFENYFELELKQYHNYFYFPLTNESFHASITPKLAGDSCIDLNSFFLKPVTMDDLFHSNYSRNFWVKSKNYLWSATGNSLSQKQNQDDHLIIHGGFLWHKTIRKNDKIGLKSEILNFIPSINQSIELMNIKITNISEVPQYIQVSSAIPIYGRSADNIRDHNHVTSLLNQLKITNYGVILKPTLSFDERGHTINTNNYQFYMTDANLNPPDEIYPLMDQFIGDGSLDWPDYLTETTYPKIELENSQGLNVIGSATYFDTKLNPNEMRNVAETGDPGGNGGGGKSIVCTAMYQTTGLQDWAKAMKIWYIYQKRYLTIQHQEGYHKLFKPFVKAMHKSNIVKAIGAHFAKHRTQHLKHILFKSKPSMLGKVYSKVLETICYWAGKK